MPKKNVPINYTSRDFGRIKNDLVAHAKRYYPTTFKDFNEAGFGSLMLDAVAYLGDQLSFYIDYQANESFLTTANEFENINKLARQMGFRLRENPSSHGIATFFILVPANTNGLGPDPRYVPVLKRGSVFSSRSGNDFTLNEDVRFDGDDNEIVVGQVDDATGLPTSYAIRGYGRIVSGRNEETQIAVGDFTRFLRVPIDVSNVAEVISVVDDEGLEYFEVDYLSQDVVYRPVLNRTETAQDAPALLRPFTVPRRFVVERDGREVFLRFGHGSDAPDTTVEAIADPSAVVLEIHGKNFITDESFDPTNLISTDKFGVVPVNTTLNVTIRTNTSDNVNAGVDTVTKVSEPVFEFTDVTGLDRNLVASVRTSLEVTNEEIISGDVTIPTTEELKQRVFNSFSAQNRAVTREDYITLIYQMPPVFGSIKRVNVLRDPDSFKRNLNIYVVSENDNGRFTETNRTVKENLRVWLNKNRMINDTIDILDAKILNFGVDFEVIGDLERDKFDILTACNRNITREFARVREIGEPLFITDIYTALKDTKGVVDITRVKVKLKTGGSYSDIRFNISDNTSADGRWINIPENAIFEIKFPDTDIKGVIK
jgi:hypothetical protein